VSNKAGMHDSMIVVFKAVADQMDALESLQVPTELSDKQTKE